MKLSTGYIPLLKDVKKTSGEDVISHKLMVKAGMIKQTSNGIYAWLPLGLKVMRNIEKIVREEMDKAGCQEILMPTIQSADLWRKSNRYDSYGKEMLKIKDRHDKDMLFGPTNEEMITDIFRQDIKSYKQLPQNLYHIQWKFRDEIRPRFGIMRAREFLMFDGYSFDETEDQCRETYKKYFQAYQAIFKRLGLQAMPVKADTGAIGGSLSHEFHVLAKTGESAIYHQNIDGANDENVIDSLTIDTQTGDIQHNGKPFYCAADEMHTDNANNPEKCPVSADELVEKRGIEVGHIFMLGDKYSKAMDAKVIGKDGKPFYPQMGCYGIGVSRLVAAIIEANHDEHGIIWPAEVSPFDVHIINYTKQEDGKKVAEHVYNALTSCGLNVLLDDRDVSPRDKNETANLLGTPYQFRIGSDALPDRAERKFDLVKREPFTSVQEQKMHPIFLRVEDLTNRRIYLHVFKDRGSSISGLDILTEELEKGDGRNFGLNICDLENDDGRNLGLNIFYSGTSI